jgi:site-specific recombinase XerD
MTALREKFISYMRYRHYSQNTINIYSACLIQLSQYYNLSPDSLTRDQFLRYLYYLTEERQVSTVYLNQLLSAYKILIAEVLMRPYEDFDIRRPKSEKKLPDILSQKEIMRIIDICWNLKHRTLIALIYSCGLRVSEVTQLKPADIDSTRMQIHIRTAKGAKDRFVMLSEKILLMLRKYWELYRPKVFLFEGQKQGKALSVRTVQSAFTKAVKQAGIHKNVCVHTLRHSRLLSEAEICNTLTRKWCQSACHTKITGTRTYQNDFDLHPFTKFTGLPEKSLR